MGSPWKPSGSCGRLPLISSRYPWLCTWFYFHEWRLIDLFEHNVLRLREVLLGIWKREADFQPQFFSRAATWAYQSLCVQHLSSSKLQSDLVLLPRPSQVCIVKATTGTPVQQLPWVQQLHPVLQLRVVLKPQFSNWTRFINYGSETTSRLLATKHSISRRNSHTIRSMYEESFRTMCCFQTIVDEPDVIQPTRFATDTTFWSELFALRSDRYFLYNFDHTFESQSGVEHVYLPPLICSCFVHHTRFSTMSKSSVEAIGHSNHYDLLPNLNNHE